MTMTMTIPKEAEPLVLIFTEPETNEAFPTEDTDMTLPEEQEPSMPALLPSSHSLHRQPGQEGAGAGGEQDWGEVDSVLSLTVRVLEMVARGRQGGSRNMVWGQIRRIAEREEERNED